ncbi:MAG: right-handed parallel beta-helix repeat-containing protein [Clostridia bacterium]|nr:right-handed parallel beta-helix repeat-containing protein [Clostridia bacterium]
MLLKYKETEYNNKIEYLRNNGYTVNNVALDYEDFTTDVENQTLFAEFQLPNGGKSYKDYSAIVAWSNYLENDDASVERSYSGMPVPITFTADNNGNPVICSYVFEDTATEGIVRLTITITGTMEHTDADFKYYIDNLRGLMFIEGDECTLDPDVSLVVPNLEAFFAQVNATQTFQLDLTTKTRLLSLGDDEEFSACRCFEVIPEKNPVDVAGALIDGSHYYINENEYKLVDISKKIKPDLVGFASIEELDATELSLVADAARTNSKILKDIVANSSLVCLYLEKDKIFPICESLPLKSNLRIEGNGSTIMASAMKADGETYTKKEMFIIGNSADSSIVSNVTFENLIFKGRFDGSDVGVDDQCVKTLSEYPLLKNLNFEKVTFTGFKFAVHPGSINKNRPTESSCWSFNNCVFTECATPAMLSYIDDVSFTNCHFSASLSDRETEHCIYISGGTSHIIVDNCLLENAMGAGIVNSCATNALKENETVDNPSEDRIETAELMMRNNRFTNNQIRNCNMGIIIGNPSENILIENIFVTNVSRALVLQNCKNVVVNNFNASGCSYYEYIRMDTEGDTHWGSEPNDWFALAIRGYVQAKITNSFFSTGGLMFTCSESFFPTDGLGERIEVDIDFEDCVFLTTFSEYLEKEVTKDGVTTIEYTQPECFLGLACNSKYDASQHFYYNILFSRCQFHMNSENNENSMILLRGFADDKSKYYFNNCLITYRDGNGNPNDDVPEYDANGNLIDAMPKSYFISPYDGTYAEITGCIFYNNRDIYPELNKKYGFVKVSLEKNCTIYDNTKYDQKLIITNNIPSSENEETTEETTTE